MKNKLFLGFILSLFLLGCSTQSLKVDKEHELAKKYLAQKKDKKSVVEQKSEYFLGAVQDNAYYKRAFAQKVASQKIVMHRTFYSLPAFAKRLHHLTQIPITLDESLEKETLKEQLLHIDYEGDVKGLLNDVCAQTKSYWEITNESVHLFRYKTKTFRIMALPGNTQLKNTITNATGSTDTASQTNTDERSSKGGSVTEAKISVDSMSVWTSLEKAIRAILSKNGKVIVTPATATVSVTDTPDVLERVNQYINQQNALLSQRVQLLVRVVSVELSNGDQYGINWDVLYNKLSGNLGVRLHTAFSQSDRANLTFRVLSNNGSPWSGSQAILSALSEQGKVSNLTSATLSTLNNQVVPLQVGRQIAYLKRASTTLTDGTSVSNALDPGTINTGLTLSVLPQVIDENHLILQFSVDISALVSLNQVQSGSSMIQTPQVDTRNFLQRVKMAHGDTLVVTGFEQNITNENFGGIGGATNLLFGGHANKKQENTIMVIVIQACIGG